MSLRFIFSSADKVQMYFLQTARSPNSANSNVIPMDLPYVKLRFHLSSVATFTPFTVCALLNVGLALNIEKTLLFF